MKHPNLDLMKHFEENISLVSNELLAKHLHYKAIKNRNLQPYDKNIIPVSHRILSLNTISNRTNKYNDRDDT